MLLLSFFLNFLVVLHGPFFYTLCPGRIILGQLIQKTIISLNRDLAKILMAMK